MGGSGGGGITASRLARARQPGLYLERGREIHPGEYPSGPEDMQDETQIDSPHLHIGSEAAHHDLEINVFLGRGLGGT